MTLTLREGNTTVRVISAWDMSRKERNRYEQETTSDLESTREERVFRERHDSSGHVDWSKAQRARFPSLHPSTRPISLRIAGCAA